MVMINWFLRFISLKTFVLSVLVFVPSFLPTLHLSPSIFPTANYSLTGKAFTSAEFVNPLLGALFFTVSTACGYAATFYAPKDKVKVSRAAVIFCAAMAYLFLSDTYRQLNGSTTRWTTSIQGTYAYGAISAVVLVWSLACALTVDGGVVDHVPDSRGKDKYVKTA